VLEAVQPASHISEQCTPPQYLRRDENSVHLYREHPLSSHARDPIKPQGSGNHLVPRGSSGNRNDTLARKQ